MMLKAMRNTLGGTIREPPVIGAIHGERPHIGGPSRRAVESRPLTGLRHVDGALLLARHALQTRDRVVHGLFHSSISATPHRDDAPVVDRCLLPVARLLRQTRP